MRKRIVTNRLIQTFEDQLRLDERSEATISKYLHDIRYFAAFLNGGFITKESTLSYKTTLKTRFAVSSANSMIAALNAFLRFAGWPDCCIKQFKVQKTMYCSESQELSKAEYIRLVEAAKRQGKERLYLILLTICGTGIRVSELPFITAEAVKKGEATVSCKSKTRTVFIVRVLQKKLLRYIKDQQIGSGPVFVTKGQKPINRCNIWREMKSLCKTAEVSPDKVFPHNLRHLFAKIFYSIEKDLAKLADILGHFSINTTRLYIISSGTEHRRKMEHMRLII